MGLIANTFKERYGGHKGDFKNPEKRTSSILTVNILRLKDKRKDFENDWEVICRASPFSPITGI